MISKTLYIYINLRFLLTDDYYLYEIYNEYLHTYIQSKIKDISDIKNDNMLFGYYDEFYFDKKDFEDSFIDKMIIGSNEEQRQIFNEKK